MAGTMTTVLLEEPGIYLGLGPGI